MNKKIEPFGHPFSDTQEDTVESHSDHLYEEPNLSRIKESAEEDTVDPVALCEELYPETTKEFKDIQQDQYALFCMKQLDYGPQNITLGKDTDFKENRKLSLLGIWFRSNDKIQRILNLVQSDRNPKNESLEDSWIDLSNYSIISMLVNRNKWGK